MKIRSSIELLLNLGNYSNIKLIGDVQIDTELQDDLLKLQSLPGGAGVTADSSPEELAGLVQQLVIDSLKEQKEALDDLNAEFFEKPARA
jgi:hypothetical protein